MSGWFEVLGFLLGVSGYFFFFFCIHQCGAAGTYVSMVPFHVFVSHKQNKNFLIILSVCVVHMILFGLRIIYMQM